MDSDPQPFDYILPLVQSLLFIASVYLEKTVRKTLKWPKKYKEISRISFVSLLTLILIAFNYTQKCQSEGINFTECFYLNFDITQCIHVLVANSILFGYSLSRIPKDLDRFKASLQPSPWKKILFAPLLEQLLFRAVFFRSGRGNVSIVYFSAIFALSHLHKHIRKAISGKQKRIGGALFQLFFTFIFSLYCYYFLSLFQSVIPCIVLHVYCNILGPPIIEGRKSLIYNSACIVLFFLYVNFML